MTSLLAASWSFPSLIRRGLLAAALAIAALVPALAQPTVVVGKVVGVSDGDTVTVLDADKRQHKVRLVGIDAPEKKQAFGERAKQSLSEMVFAREVTVRVLKQDRYGRALGKIELDGQDINLEQIRRGSAWHYKQYARDQLPEDRRLYADAELTARAQRVGLWQDPQPVAPWDFRRPPR